MNIHIGHSALSVSEYSHETGNSSLDLQLDWQATRLRNLPSLPHIPGPVSQAHMAKPRSFPCILGIYTQAIIHNKLDLLTH